MAMQNVENSVVWDGYWRVSRITQDYQQYHHSIERIRLPIQLL